ncbi:MAG: inosine/uridine-preferring nucleoside hydrolase [Candidatus Aramenus sulfurataquae]|jgi:purine nucleosidase|uniref:Nucleoside hydrolase n=2 Tax=Candidatus Aramenus sulfurataquae TaxID=1326980 RepID=W7KW28_9CREN|nr:MAG: inosine/uridine-preferring nucleoside hydrolase [Candidatus Aramenus sulfurataquae]MCL7343701.1 nucleoside hydrolase [Candidatus Aramenus sulfurataquae]
MRNAIIDSDTASDDTIAILLSSRLFNLVGITIVAGNVSYEQEVKNALFTVEYFNIKSPVFLGSSRPIMGKWRTVEEVHGKNGMGDWDYGEPSVKPEREHAVDAIIRLSKEYDNLEVLAVSPLTNLALAYLKDPSIVKRIKKVWIMGGAFSRGNTTPIAEFNFWVDPEAASIVLNAGFDITIVPWEVTEEYAYVDDDFWSKIEGLKSRASEFFIRANRALREYSKSHGQKGSVQTDSFTVFLAHDQSAILKKESHHVNVETCSSARGAMLVDWYGLNGKPNAEIVLKGDRDKFVNFLLSVLSS